MARKTWERINLAARPHHHHGDTLEKEEVKTRKKKKFYPCPNCWNCICMPKLINQLADKEREIKIIREIAIKWCQANAGGPEVDAGACVDFEIKRGRNVHKER